MLISTALSPAKAHGQEPVSNAGATGGFCFSRWPVLSRRSSPVGFTLLELAVVLFIIGLVLMIAMPRLGSFQGTELRVEAHRLATRSRYLYEEAGSQKVLLRLNFDLDRSTYFVTRLDPF